MSSHCPTCGQPLSDLGARGKQIGDMADEGCGAADIAKALSLSVRQVQRVLRRLGKARPRGAPVRG